MWEDKCWGLWLWHHNKVWVRMWTKKLFVQWIYSKRVGVLIIVHCCFNEITNVCQITKSHLFGLYCSNCLKKVSVVFFGVMLKPLPFKWFSTCEHLIKLNVLQVRGSREAMTIQDWAAQRCTISYRAPELFNVESHCIIDERTDIWVRPFVLYHV